MQIDMSKPVQIMAPVVHSPTAEEVEDLTMGVFTVRDGVMVAVDPDLTPWLESMRRGS